MTNEATDSCRPSRQDTHHTETDYSEDAAFQSVYVIEPDYDLSTCRGFDGDALSEVPGAFDAFLTSQEMLWG